MTTLRMKAAAACAAALMVSGCMSAGPTTQVQTQYQPAAQYQSSSNTAASASLHATLNAERAARGLGNVRSDRKLAAAATAHAKDMALKNYFSHYEPDGGNPVTRVAEAGGCRATVSENIAENWNDEMKVFWAWMGSPGHYKNMMGGKYTRYGMGEYDGHYVMVLAGPCV